MEKLEVPPTIGRMVYQVRYFHEDMDERTETLEVGSCDGLESTIEDMMSPSLLEKYGGAKNYLDQFDCLIDPKASLASSPGRTDFKSIEASFVPCVAENPETECVTNVGKYEAVVGYISFKFAMIENKIII